MHVSKKALRSRSDLTFHFSYDKAVRYAQSLHNKIHGDEVLLRLNIPVEEQNKNAYLGKWFGVFIFRIIAEREGLHPNSIKAGVRELTPDPYRKNGVLEFRLSGQKNSFIQYRETTPMSRDKALYYRVIPFPDGRILLWRGNVKPSRNNKWKARIKRFDTLVRLREEMFFSERLEEKCR